MSGDYSRFTHKPEKGYSSVDMQQGRVQLDADWNEQAEIFKRRWETQAQDIFGEAAVSTLTTPDAFKVTPVAVDGGGYELEIGGPGRMYVDGLVAEVFPGESWTYRNQKHWPTPEELPTNGYASVYLDVWEREITYLQDGDLLEKALDGPDTTTRRQTVWQVKVDHFEQKPIAGSGRCPSKLTTASGLLSADSKTPPPSGDPCELPPSGGYSGLENRLYRVEIHAAGKSGEAKFKWSKDNASIISAVTNITENTDSPILHVSRIGRDKVLRFQPGDWVEVIDDHQELDGKAGQMAKVSVIDEANLTITLDRSISSGDFGQNSNDLKSRHTRVVRWDQNSGVNTLDNGLITIEEGQQIDLGDGVYVSFSFPNNAEMKVGDYWCFHARTADGSVEELVDEPPRGIIHHYAPLAFIDLSLQPQPEATDDCRNLWPLQVAGGCCTVAVRPGDDIQAAIDRLDSGGTVCLLAGEYRLNQPIRTNIKKLAIKGCGNESKIIAPVGNPALIIDAPEDPYSQSVKIESVLIKASSSSAGTVVLDNRKHIEITNSTIVSVPLRTITASNNLAMPEGLDSSGLSAHEETSPELFLASLFGPALTCNSCFDLKIKNNVLVGRPTIVFQATKVEVLRNSIKGGGVWLLDGSEEIKIIENEIKNGNGAGILLGGLPKDDEFLVDEPPGTIPGFSYEGIDSGVVGVTNGLIGLFKNNLKELKDGLESESDNLKFIDADEAEGILNGAMEFFHRFDGVKVVRDDASGVSNVQIHRNNIFGMGNSGISTNASIDNNDELGEIDELVISQNSIERCGQKGLDTDFDADALGGIVLRNTVDLKITDNIIKNNPGFGYVNNEPYSRIAACGIFTYECTYLDIKGNEIADNGATEQRCLDFKKTILASRNPLSFHRKGLKLIVYKTLDEQSEIARTSLLASDSILLMGLSCYRKVTIDLCGKPEKMANICFSIKKNPGVVGSNNPPKVILKAFNNTDKLVADAEVKFSYQSYFITSVELKADSAFERIEIITDEMEGSNVLLLDACFMDDRKAIQGGVVCLSANISEGGIGHYIKQDLTISDNKIDSPIGKALIVEGVGSMSVKNNKIMTNAGYCYSMDSLGIIPPNNVKTPNRQGKEFNAQLLKSTVIDFGESISIYNWGSAINVVDRALDGWISFHGNFVKHNTVVFLKDMEFASTLRSSVCLLSRDDIDAVNNKMLITIVDEISSKEEKTDAISIFSNLLAAAVTMRVTENRFSEPIKVISNNEQRKLFEILFSCVSFGVGNITALNHGIYPILNYGVKTSNPDSYPDNQTTF